MGRSQRRERHGRLVTACLLGIVLAGCQADRPTPSPSAPLAETQGPSSMPVATAAPPTMAPTPPPLGTGDITARYDDGLPREIGGQPVLRGQAAIDFAATRTDDTPFLITGWVEYV